MTHRPNICLSSETLSAMPLGRARRLGIQVREPEALKALAVRARFRRKSEPGQCCFAQQSCLVRPHDSRPDTK